MFHLVFESHDGRALGAESEEKREPVSDIDTEVVDSLKVLHPDGRLEKRPNRCVATKRRDVPLGDICNAANEHPFPVHFESLVRYRRLAAAR